MELESCRRKLRSRFLERFRESRFQNGDATLIAVIQCAATKHPDAGHLVSAGGKPVVFVAHPETAPTDKSRIYARPDDASDNGMTWRQVLLQYNESKQNPLGLLPAYSLYSNGIYRRLKEAFGIDRFFVLSAGWGLIRADFLTPAYDITFSQNVANYKRRRKMDCYDDFSMLPDTDAEIVFFGGREYVPLFCALTARAAGARRVFFNSAHRPQVEGCMFEKFETRTRTNWHYECASAFLAKHCFE